MRVLRFRYFGRVGHFLRAEMNASALSYPVPPRTSLLGLLGNILGLGKDEAATVLSAAKLAVGGPLVCSERGSRESYPPRRHYHRANIRSHDLKTLPTDALALRILPAERNDTLPDPTGLGAAKQVIQEWLLNPEFTVYVGAPSSEPWGGELEERLRNGRTHFTPCLGLAWMLAQVELSGSLEADPLPDGNYDVQTVCRQSAGQLDPQQILQRGQLAVQQLRMPRSVSADRVFTHENYYLEMNGQPLPVTITQPEQAWSFGTEIISFL